MGVMGQLEQIADIARSKAAMVTGEVNADFGRGVCGGGRDVKKHEEAAAIRGLFEELPALQKTQMQRSKTSPWNRWMVSWETSRDERHDQGGGGSPGAHGGGPGRRFHAHAKPLEKAPQARLQTQRGEEFAAEKEKAEKAEAMAEMRRTPPSYQREQAAKAEGDNFRVVM